MSCTDWMCCLLQANDFEAYQQILRETAGPGTAGERYEVISRFLSSTEEYLHKLASKVASVKLSQEASEAAAVAVSRARAQVLLPYNAPALDLAGWMHHGFPCLVRPCLGLCDT